MTSNATRSARIARLKGAKPLALAFSQAVTGLFYRLGSRAHLLRRVSRLLQDVVLRCLFALLLPTTIWRLGWRNGILVWSCLLFPREINLRHRALDLHIRIRRASTDIFVFYQVFVLNEYQSALKLTNPSLIIDAGAYTGYTSVLFARHFPNARVLAIEPDEVSYVELANHAAQCPNIVPVRAALWPTDGENVEIRDPGFGQWALQIQPVQSATTHSKTIPTVTLGSMLHHYGAGRLDLVKLDIEGAEGVLFADAMRDGWLSSVTMLIIELHEHIVPGCEDPVLQALAEYPFTPYYVGENLVLQRET